MMQQKAWTETCPNGLGVEDARRMRSLRDAFDRFAGECAAQGADPVETSRYFRGFAASDGLDGRPIAFGGTLSESLFYGMAAVGDEDAGLVCAVDADRALAPMWFAVAEGSIAGPFAGALDAASSVAVDMGLSGVRDASRSVRWALEALCGAVRGVDCRTELDNAFGALGISPADGLGDAVREWASLQGVADGGVGDVARAVLELRERARGDAGAGE